MRKRSPFFKALFFCKYLRYQRGTQIENGFLTIAFVNVAIKCIKTERSKAMKELKTVIRPDRPETQKYISAQIRKRISANSVGGSKVFITEISGAMRIRIGQRGEDAH
jgi:hypothetical protein